MREDTPRRVFGRNVKYLPSDAGTGFLNCLQPNTETNYERFCCFGVTARGRRIIVIGASAGGIVALTGLIRKFEASWPVSVFITVHIGNARSRLADILNGASPMPVQFAEHGCAFGTGFYVAPPDRHLIVDDTKTFLTAGPKENHTRPAIDPMFRSAASHHGSRVIGVLLTGYLSDGMNGLYDIQEHGGTTIVQHPLDAQIPEMPMNALTRIKPTYVLPLAEIPNAIAEQLERKEASADWRRQQ
jgi:two-component system, chemotaxis family, protein-glutamate methylesterase/glutaminase